MYTRTANQTKTQFGKVLMDVQRKPIKITKNGQAVAIMMSMEEYAEVETMKLQLLKNRVSQGEMDVAAGDVVDGEQFFEQILLK